MINKKSIQLLYCVCIINSILYGMHEDGGKQREENTAPSKSSKQLGRYVLYCGVVPAAVVLCTAYYHPHREGGLSGILKNTLTTNYLEILSKVAIVGGALKLLDWSKIFDRGMGEKEQAIEALELSKEKMIKKIKKIDLNVEELLSDNGVLTPYMTTYIELLRNNMEAVKAPLEKALDEIIQSIEEIKNKKFEVTNNKIVADSGTVNEKIIKSEK